MLLVELDFRSTFPRLYWLAKPGKMPGPPRMVSTCTSPHTDMHTACQWQSLLLTSMPLHLFGHLYAISNMCHCLALHLWTWHLWCMIAEVHGTPCNYFTDEHHASCCGSYTKCANKPLPAAPSMPGPKLLILLLGVPKNTWLFVQLCLKSSFAPGGATAAIVNKAQ